MIVGSRIGTRYELMTDVNEKSPGRDSNPGSESVDLWVLSGSATTSWGLGPQERLGERRSYGNARKIVSDCAVSRHDGQVRQGQALREPELETEPLFRWRVADAYSHRLLIRSALIAERR